MMGGGLRELVICHHCTYQDMQWFEDSLTHVYMVHYTYIDVHKYIHIIFKIEVIVFEVHVRVRCVLHYDSFLHIIQKLDY